MDQCVDILERVHSFDPTKFNAHQATKIADFLVASPTHKGNLLFNICDHFKSEFSEDFLYSLAINIATTPRLWELPSQYIMTMGLFPNFPRWPKLFKAARLTVLFLPPCLPLLQRVLEAGTFKTIIIVRA